MKSKELSNKLNTKEKLSTLWIVVMFSMIFADILSFMLPDFLKNLMDSTANMKINQEIMLLMAILLEVPIVMIYLSRILKYKANRLLNIIAAVITIIFVTVGGSTYLHYIFFATVEVIFMLLIIWHSWTWQIHENEVAKD